MYKREHAHHSTPANKAMDSSDSQPAAQQSHLMQPKSAAQVAKHLRAAAIVTSSAWKEVGKMLQFYVKQGRKSWWDYKRERSTLQ